MSDIQHILFDPTSQEYKISADYTATIPFWLTHDDTPPAQTIPANETLPSRPMSQRFEGIFRGEYLYCLRSNDEMTIRLNGTGGYRYNNNEIPVHIQTLFSEFGGRPFVLPEAMYLPSRENLFVEYTNLTGNPITAQMVVAGLLYIPSRITSENLQNRVVREASRWKWLRPHWSGLDNDGVVTVGAGATVQDTLTVDETGFFSASKIAIYSPDGLADLTIRAWDGADRQMMSAAIPATFFGGDDEYPFIIPVKWALPEKTRIRFELVDASQQERDVYITVIGKRLLPQAKR